MSKLPYPVAFGLVFGAVLSSIALTVFVAGRGWSVQGGYAALGGAVIVYLTCGAAAGLLFDRSRNLHSSTSGRLLVSIEVGGVCAAMGSSLLFGGPWAWTTVHWITWLMGSLFFAAVFGVNWSRFRNSME